MAKLRVPAAETRVSLSDVEVKPPTFKEMLVAFVVVMVICAGGILLGWAILEALATIPFSGDGGGIEPCRSPCGGGNPRGYI